MSIVQLYHNAAAAPFNTKKIQVDSIGRLTLHGHPITDFVLATVNGVNGVFATPYHPNSGAAEPRRFIAF